MSGDDVAATADTAGGSDGPVAFTDSADAPGDAPTEPAIARSGGTPAAATAANAFNNFKSFLRADDVTDPMGSTHIT